MKLKYIIYALVGVSTLWTSCSKDPQVLEFDPSYTPKRPTPGQKDKLPPVDLLTVYGYFNDNMPTKVVNRTLQSDGTVAVPEIGEMEVGIHTSVAVETDATIMVEPVTATNNADLYGKLIKGTVVELPADAYKLTDASHQVQKGKKLDAKAKLSFVKEKFQALD